MLYLYVLVIPHYYINRPFMYNLLELLNVTDKHILLSVSKYVKAMILLRNSIVNVCSPNGEAYSRRFVRRSADPVPCSPNNFKTTINI